MAGKKGTVRHTPTEEEIYAYYEERYRKMNTQSEYGKKTSQIQTNYFKTNFDAMRNRFYEKGQRQNWKRVVNKIVDKQLFAYETKSARSQAKYINEQLTTGELEVTAKDIRNGIVQISESTLNKIYAEKKEYYKEKFDQIFPNFEQDLREEGYSEGEIEKKVKRAREKYSVKESAQWISSNIYGSK